MNPTKALVTGAVALTAFASVLGIAYAQVETTTEPMEPTAQTQQVPEIVTPAEPGAEQTLAPAPQTEEQRQQQLQQEQMQQSQTQQSQTVTPETQWQQQAPATQEPLPSESSAPAPRADRN